jgi:hypothetical protein
MLVSSLLSRLYRILDHYQVTLLIRRWSALWSYRCGYPGKESFLDHSSSYPIYLFDGMQNVQEQMLI